MDGGAFEVKKMRCGKRDKLMHYRYGVTFFQRLNDDSGVQRERSETRILGRHPDKNFGARILRHAERTPREVVNMEVHVNCFRGQ